MFRCQIWHVSTHARAGHHHGDRSYWTGVRTKAMANALVSIYDHGFAGDHRKYVALGTNRGASCTADTVVSVDMWMLGLRTFRKQLPLLGSFVRASIPLLQIPQVSENEEERDGRRDCECDQ